MPKKQINGEELRFLKEQLAQNKKSAEVVTELLTVWQGQALSTSVVYRWKKNTSGGAAQKECVHSIMVDEPLGFLGTDVAPKPTELALAALGSCLVVGVVYNAALRGITLDQVTIELNATMSRLGFLGLAEGERPGFTNVNVRIHIKSPSPKKEIDQLVEYVQTTSPVLDLFQNPVPIQLSHTVN